MIQLKPFITSFGARLSLALTLAILWVGMGTGVVLAQPEEPANGNKPSVIAVVPIESTGPTPLTALIEARLSSNAHYVLVDREHIAQVTEEWELAALSSASSVSKRVEVGRLLGADILVLFSESSSPSPHCEVVVSETARGLRLRTATLPTLQHPEDDVRAVEGEIEIALKKLAEGISKIHAVPPFVSMDLSGDHAHLNGAYARMVEAMLLEIPGTLVVEIAEAREIAAETALTDVKVGRAMPVYLMGEYRFDTANPDKPPFVRITAQRGGRKVGGREAGGLTPESAVPFIRKSVMELLETAGGGELPEPNATIEWQILAARARDHFALGYFEESAQLAEAGLLLDGRQPQLHQLAMSAYGRCCWGAKKSVNETLRYYDRALAHLEEFLMQSQFTRLDPEVYNAISQAFAESVGLTNHADESTRKDVFAFRKRARNTYLRVIAAKHDRGTLNDAVLDLILFRWLFEHDMYGESLRDNLRKRLEAAPMLLDAAVERPGAFIGMLVEYGLSDAMKRTGDYLWFLDELGRIDHPAVKSVLASERRLIAGVQAKVAVCQPGKSGQAR